MPLTFTLPDANDVVVKDASGETLFTEQLHILNELVRFAQVGLDMKDPLILGTWTNRLAVLLNDRFSIPPEKNLNGGQALLLARGIVDAWNKVADSFSPEPQ